MADFIPMDAFVLSADALCARLRAEFSSSLSIDFCRLHYRSIHDTYFVKAAQGPFYLKVYRYQFRTKEEIRQEVHCLLHLERFGITVPSPIPTDDGRYVLEFPTVLGMRYGVLYRGIGEKPFEEVEETPAVNEAIGRAIAQIHCAWDQMPMQPSRWKLDAKTFLDDSMRHIEDFSQLYPIDVDFLSQVAVGTKQKINELPAAQPGFGMCHGDLYGGNIRYDSAAKPVLFDFDFCGMGWRMYDLSLYACSFKLGCDAADIEKRERRKDAVLNGYAKVRAVSSREVDTMLLFIPFRRIFNIGTIYISMSNVWGDFAALRSTTEDIRLLKQWLELNPVL